MSPEAHAQPKRKQLRQFGLMVGAIIISIGLWQLYRGTFETGRIVLWSIGGVLFLSGLLIPVILTPVYTVWMKLAHALAWINTRIIITLIFFLVITPTGFLLRLIKGDILREKLDQKTQSYWSDYEPVTSVKEHCERQF